MIREERPVFWEVIGSIIVKKNHSNTCPIPMARELEIFEFTNKKKIVNGNKEREII
jgi:hypothetical protein